MAKIHDAATRGDVDAVKTLLEAGADVNLKTWFSGHTPLRLAVENGHEPVVALLLGKGPSDDLAPLLTLAAEKGHADVVTLLLRQGVKGDLKQLSMTAIKMGHTGLVKTFLDSGIDDGPKINLEAGLALAVTSRRLEVAAYLIERGADVTARRAKTPTFLMLAAAARDAKMARLLLDHGADVNAKIENGKKFTPDGPQNTRDFINFLLSDKFDGATALHWAFPQAKLAGTLWDELKTGPSPSLELIELLLTRGANVNAMMITGLTPLWAAIRSDPKELRMEVVKLLLEFGADVKAQWNEKILLNYVREYHNDKTVWDEDGDKALAKLLQGPVKRRRPVPPGKPAPEQQAPTSPISFRCGSCSKALKASAQAAGKTTKCPQCSKPVVVPPS